MAIKYLEHFDRVRSSSNEIKGAVQYIAVGGAAKIARIANQGSGGEMGRKRSPNRIIFSGKYGKIKCIRINDPCKVKSIKKTNPANIEFTKS